MCGGAAGSIDFGGGALPASGGEDAFVAKFSGDGSHLWSRLIGGPAAEQRCQDVIVEADDHIAVAGYFDGSIDLDGTVHTSNGEADLFVAKLSP